MWWLSTSLQAFTDDAWGSNFVAVLERLHWSLERLEQSKKSKKKTLLSVTWSETKRENKVNLLSVFKFHDDAQAEDFVVVLKQLFIVLKTWLTMLFKTQTKHWKTFGLHDESNDLLLRSGTAKKGSL